jgi:archaellin
MRLQAGSPSINMDLVSVTLVTGSVRMSLTFVEGSGAAHGGAVAGTSYSANTTGSASTWIDAEHVVKQGDVISVTVTGLTLDHTQAVTIKIVPTYGSSTLVNFVTPSYYSTKLVGLR